MLLKGNFQNFTSKVYYKNFRGRSFSLYLWYQRYCNLTVEIKDIKYGPRTQKHGGWKKTVVDDKFL